jgi:hypothetical protein
MTARASHISDPSSHSALTTLTRGPSVGFPTKGKKKPPGGMPNGRGQMRGAGFGVEAVRRAPPQNQGLAMGAYTAFLDVALALASPALELIADLAGLGAVFLASALSVLCAAAIAMRLLYRSAPLNNGSGLWRRQLRKNRNCSA